MLKSRLIHPEILSALGRAGHGSQVLIADGNFPLSTTLGPNATQVNLNLAPGLLDVIQVLEVLLDVIPVEAAAVMQYARQGPNSLQREPEIWSDFRRLLHAAGCGFELQEIDRLDYYEAVRSPNVALTIATGEQRIYANVLLTIGVVMP